MANPFDDDGPGRPVERIDAMLKLLREAWLLVPDQRLGQVIGNAARNPGAQPMLDYRDPFNVEDDAMWAGLKRMAAGEPTGRG